MAIWLRAVWLAIVLIVPGGFALFLGFALGRALLQRWRSARSTGQQPRLREVLASVRWGDLTREFRAVAGPTGTERRADAT